MLNEFRQDLVSGEWVLFATGRSKRPNQNKEEAKRVVQAKADCPFEDPEKFGNDVVVTYLNQNQTDWFIKVAKNKFPAVLEGEAGALKNTGPFSVCDAMGMHEIVIFRDHERRLDEYQKDDLARIFKIYQERYIATFDHGSRKYTLIFHNHGFGAGASISHPHSQIMSIPILPPDVRRSLLGSEEFYKKNKKRIYDVMLDWEIEEKKRIVYENKYFIAFCPFVSKTPYEIRIFPKESHAHFEKMPEEQLGYLADAVKTSLSKIAKVLHNPDYNFFIHTAPLLETNVDPHQFYTWHIEIVPKMSLEGAFELGSGIDVNVIDPDEAAKLLREQEI
ncbi:MAG: HIT domain-containing protein [Patescibacteria group bacterium]